MLKKFFFSLTALIVLSLVAIASGTQSVSLTGHIVDKACSARVAKKDNPQTAAAGESKSCILMEKCLASGLGIFADGKYTAFDDKGVQMAKSALEKSNKDKGATFKVTGKVSDGKMAVESVTEVQ